MTPATHRIRRQRWLCSAGSTAEAFALRAHLREAQEVAVPAAFARAFDAAVPGDEVVRLPLLELHIRLASVDDLATALPELLACAVSEQLGRLLVPAARSQSPIPAPAVARRSVRESRLEALVIYLTTGSLPWELAQAETSALLEQLRETAAEDLAAVLGRAPDAQVSLSQRQAFFFRLLPLLPEERWQEIAWHLSSRLPIARAAALGRALAALAVGRSDSAGTPVADLAGALAEALGGWQGLQGQQGSQEPDESPFSPVVPEVPAVPGVPVSSLLASLPREAAAFFAPWLESAASPAPGTPAESFSIAEAAEEAFPLAVRSAGLVLLHPLLPRLFETVGLFCAGELPWAEMPRAAALLHWLATGRDEVHELELGFIKVLLGLRPEEPLLVDSGRLTAADREEGEALLQAAIQHWRALKGTTSAGLRASFLQRGGLLREDDAGWRLQVEPAAFDLLLDHLPWGIGVVKLPWMTRPIFTEWPAS